MAKKKKAADPEATEEAGGGKKKKLIIMLVALIAVGGGGYWFFLKPGPAEPPPPEPGEVVAMDPIQINLAGGHYLKLGVALQLTATAHEADGSKALDAAIDIFSGRSMNELARAEDRDAIKAELKKELEHDYHGDVMDVYFTDFVTQ